MLIKVKLGRLGMFFLNIEEKTYTERLLAVRAGNLGAKGVWVKSRQETQEQKTQRSEKGWGQIHRRLENTEYSRSREAVRNPKP